MDPRTDGWEFDVIRLESDEYVVVAVAGEIDVMTAPRLRHELAAAADLGRPLVVADLEAVTFIDAAGVGALVHGARRAAECASLLTLAAPRRTVRRVLEITDLDTYLGAHATVDDAVEWARLTSVLTGR